MDVLQFLNVVPCSIYWKDKGGKYLGCNEYMCRMAGHELDFIVGKTDHVMPWAMQANAIMQIDEYVMKNVKPYTLEERAMLFDGSEKTFLSIKNPMFDSEKRVIGVIGVSIDITEQQEMRRLLCESEKSLLKATTAQDEFLRKIQDESTNSIQVIRTMSEFLVENWGRITDKKKFEVVQYMSGGVERFCTMTDNIIALSRSVSDNIELVLEKHSLTKVISEYVDYFNKKFDCDVRFTHTDNAFIMNFDAQKITSVMLNLLLNAKKYSYQKRPISVHLVQALIGGYLPAVQCCIRDEARKIKQDELETIFLPFAQGSETKNASGGIGIGLAVCKRIIEAHAGKIWTENNILPEGNTFNFIIPMTLEAYESLDCSKS